MTNQFKVSIYIRVSTSKQANEGDSLDEQEKELKKFCEYKNYLIHKTHIEAGRSAKDTNRPEYQRLMKDIEAGKINAVVVKKLDRLSRSLLDFEGFMVTAQKHNVEFISLKENFDTTTAMGKAMLRVALVFAQLEREQTSERIIDVMSYRAQQGLYNGGIIPYGYDSLNKELVINAQEKKVLELIFNQFLETKSTVTTADFLNKAGSRNRNGKLWDPRTLDYLLHNTIYKGLVRWNDNLFRGIHQPLISDRKFEEVQDIFSKRKNLPKHTKTNAILQRILFCGDCQSPMSPSHSYNRTKQKYFYYRCTSVTESRMGKAKSNCSIKQISFNNIEARVINLLLALAGEQSFRMLENRIINHNQMVAQKAQAIKELLIVSESKLTGIKDQKDRYLDSLISQQFLAVERQRINQKLEELDLEEKQAKAEIYRQQFEANQETENKIDIVSFKRNLVIFKKDYESFSPEAKRQFLNSIIQEIKYYPEKLSIHFRELPWPMDFEG